ncbi:hypothetical protein PN36_01370 [Candidatus Thiomargarita nelsonii]|uniref:Uncharacterized protein n=1 Tax=Candidatus Thiomargarita nelsonii TaxID=1003181 RepID=A0A0A6P1J2_9GAMM|nr:hypothetical protein PN36_01370 [Candidatus Thiomargarita nelsonii]
MINDPVVEEIRKYREVYAARYDNDLHKICEALRKKEQKFNVVNRGPKPLLKLRPNVSPH